MTHHPSTNNYDAEFHKFRVDMLSAEEVPLRISSLFGMCQSKTEIKLVYAKIKQEKLCSDKILSKISELGKQSFIDIDFSPPTLLEKLGFKNEKNRAKN